MHQAKKKNTLVLLEKYEKNLHPAAKKLFFNQFN